MTLLTNLPASVASLTEMRLKAAMKIVALKMEIDKYQELEKSTSESYISRTEMRLTAAIKIAALKIESDKYQELGKSAIQPNDVVAVEEKVPISTTYLPTDKNERRQSATKRDGKEPCKSKISESDWVNKQARELLGERGTRKRFTIK